MAVTELSDEVSEASGQKGEQEIVGVKLRYIKRGVIYGTGAYEKGEVRNLPVFQEAYEAGKSS